MKKMTSKTIRALFTALLAGTLLTGCSSSAAYAGETPAAASSSETITATATPEPTPGPWELSDAKIKELQETLQNDKDINGDVQCILYFESGLINLPVLRSTDNDHYLYVDWQTGASLSRGSLTMDYRNDLQTDQQNTLIYGHYVYKSVTTDRTLVFTPLAELIYEENYEANKYVCIITATEIRYYEIAHVFSCPIEKEFGTDYPIQGMDYNYLSYEDDYFANYLELIKEHEWYSTDVELTNQDHLLTLQTCIEAYPEEREIVLCKELNRVSISQ